MCPRGVSEAGRGQEGHLTRYNLSKAPGGKPGWVSDIPGRELGLHTMALTSAKGFLGEALRQCWPLRAPRESLRQPRAGLQRRGPGAGWWVSLDGRRAPTSSGTDGLKVGDAGTDWKGCSQKPQTDLVLSCHCVTSGRSLSLPEPQSSHLRDGGIVCPSPQPPRAWQIVKHDTRAGCLPFSISCLCSIF